MSNPTIESALNNGIYASPKPENTTSESQAQKRRPSDSTTNTPPPNDKKTKRPPSAAQIQSAENQILALLNSSSFRPITLSDVNCLISAVGVLRSSGTAGQGPDGPCGFESFLLRHGKAFQCQINELFDKVDGLFEES